MINVNTNIFCIGDNCSKIPTFNYPGISKGLYCKSHQKPGMINLKILRCIEEGCHSKATFNYSEMSKGLYCENHHKEGMINIKDANKMLRLMLV